MLRWQGGSVRDVPRLVGDFVQLQLQMRGGRVENSGACGCACVQRGPAARTPPASARWADPSCSQRRGSARFSTLRAGAGRMRRRACPGRAACAGRAREAQEARTAGGVQLTFVRQQRLKLVLGNAPVNARAHCTRASRVHLARARPSHPAAQRAHANLVRRVDDKDDAAHLRRCTQPAWSGGAAGRRAGGGAPLCNSVPIDCDIGPASIR